VVGNPMWDNAMDEEMAGLDVDATWKLVVLPKDKKAIRCKWVHKVKHNADGSVIQNKIGCQKLCPNLWHRLLRDL